MNNFSQVLAKKAGIIEEALDDYLPQPDTYPPVIHQAMRYSIFAGGKRLRPALVLAAAEAAGSPAAQALPAACAIEMLHTYSLVHDDLPAMDNDDLRRGKPTSHRVYGEAVAVLAGDALLTLAFQLLGQQSLLEGLPAERSLQVVVEVAEASGTKGMIGGQIVDTAAAEKPLKAEELEFVHRAKTGALFKASVRSGAIIAGADQKALQELTLYAEYFGLGFQIVDDILDYTGSQAEIGKPVGSDLRNNKQTYVSLYGLKSAKIKAEEACAKAIQTLNHWGPQADFLRSAVQFLLARKS